MKSPKTSLKLILLISFTLFNWSAQARTSDNALLSEPVETSGILEIAYYGQEFLDHLKGLDSTLTEEDTHGCLHTEADPSDAYEDDKEAPKSSLDYKAALYKILNSSHVRQEGRADKLVDQKCRQLPEESQALCYERYTHSYKGSRKFLFGNLDFDLKQDPDTQEYYVEDYYCLRRYTSKDMEDKRETVGPGQIPFHRTINTEHVWPKSRFCKEGGTKNCRKKYSQINRKQISDLHHLLPTDADTNSLRASYTFGEVGSPAKNRKGKTLKVACPTADNFGQKTTEGVPSKFGIVKAVEGLEDNQRKVFEPPQKHKGNVARALFYFAVNYKLEIDPVEEYYLRKWHQEDPVDESERARHEAIFEAQKNRNPFVDYPELVDLIGNF